MSLEEIKSASQADPEFDEVRKCLRTEEWPQSPEIRPFYNVRHELSVQDTLLIRGTRIVMPRKLRQATLKLAHEGHQGVVKTKQLMREKVWWPGIDQEIESAIKQCIPCQVQRPKPPPEPLKMSTMPTEPWNVVYADLCGPFPTGESLLVLVDGCSRWPEVEIMVSTTTSALINRLEKIFALHGIPEKLTTDNGPQFTSEELKEFLVTNGIKHRRVTPYWPQANAEVERFNRSLEKSVCAAHAEGRPWKRELYKFLLNYRATPHLTTGVSPSQLLFGQTIRTKLPHLNTDEASNHLKAALQRDKRQKEKMKRYADKKCRAVPSAIQEGDKVLVKLMHRQNKLSPAYDSKPFTVVQRKGSSVILQRENGPRIMRNISHVHKIPQIAEVPCNADEDSDDEISIPELPVQQHDAHRERPRRERNLPGRFNDFAMY